MNSIIHFFGTLFAYPERRFKYSQYGTAARSLTARAVSRLI